MATRISMWYVCSHCCNRTSLSLLPVCFSSPFLPQQRYRLQVKQLSCPCTPFTHYVLITSPLWSAQPVPLEYLPLKPNEFSHPYETSTHELECVLYPNPMDRQWPQKPYRVMAQHQRQSAAIIAFLDTETWNKVLFAYAQTRHLLLLAYTFVLRRHLPSITDKLS